MTGEFIIAIHALTFIHHKNEIVSSSVLADNICSPAPRIRKVMNKLKKAGIVENINGPNGGYRLLKSAYEITLNQCLDALEEKPVYVHWMSGDIEKDCVISSGIGEAVEDLQNSLNKTCLDEMKKWNIGLLEELVLKKRKK